MDTRFRYYNSKRGNFFRGRGRGRGRRPTNLTAISIPRDNFGSSDAQHFQDRPINLNECRDETVLSISFGQNALGAAYYEQSSQIVKIMNDISEDHEFKFIKRLIEEVNPTIIIANRSQDLEFIKFLKSRYCPQETNPPGTSETSDSTIPIWEPCSADETTLQNEEEEDDDETFEGPQAKFYPLPNNFYKFPRAIDRLKLMVGSGDSSMSDEDKLTIIRMRFDLEAVNMIRSFGALLLFLDETRIGADGPLSVPTTIKSIKSLTLDTLIEIDFNTFQALNIFPKEADKKKSSSQGKSLFALMDRCRSTVGKKCLRKWFNNPTRDREELISRQKCVHFFKQDWNAELTMKIVSILGKVRSLSNVFHRFQSGTAQLIHWEGFISTVNALGDIMNIIKHTSISSELVVESGVLEEVSEITVITGSIINFDESKMQGKVMVMPGIDDDLDKLRDVYENMPTVLTEVANQEMSRLELPDYCNVSCVYVPLVGFILSLPRDFPVESYPDMSLVYCVNDEIRVRNETTERLDNHFGDILMKLIDNQTAIILALKTRILKKKRMINKILSVVAKIDALISLSLVAAENGWNCPTLLDEPVIEAAELYHPISALIVKKNFVPNHVRSGRDGVKVSVITGPNACGKSVYMKSIGILVFLTHIGSFVPARHAKIGIVDRIVSQMFTVDSVLDGMSTFAKDVEQVALALRKSTGSSLVIIDEFGKGTMTEVGLSLLASCMNYWMQKGEKRCPHLFLSSHFHSLPRYISGPPDIISYLTFVVQREQGGKVKYLFELIPGIVDCSFAIAVAKEVNYPMSVIGRACRIYKALKSENKTLREIRAEVSNEDEETSISLMESVLNDEAGFMSSISSSEWANSNSNHLNSSENEKESSFEDAQADESDINKSPYRQESVFFSKSDISINQLSIFDALLPLKKRRKLAANEEEQETFPIETPASPDPFSAYEEDM